MAVEVSIFQRWMNRSLNTSIAKLYPGPDNEDESVAAAEGASLPRAEYVVGDEYEEIGTKKDRIIVTPFLLRVWDDDWLGLLNNLDTVYDEFVDGEQATTNPICLAETDGQMIGVEFVGRRAKTKKQDVHVGHIAIGVRWSRPRTIPA